LWTWSNREHKASGGSFLKQVAWLDAFQPIVKRTFGEYKRFDLYAFWRLERRPR
jgi:hypothetical protein